MRADISLLQTAAALVCALCCVMGAAQADDYLPQPQGQPEAPRAAQGPQLTRIPMGSPALPAETHRPATPPPPALQRLQGVAPRPMVPLARQPSSPRSLPPALPALSPYTPSTPAAVRPPAGAAPAWRTDAVPAAAHRPAAPAAPRPAAAPLPAPTFAPVESRAVPATGVAPGPAAAWSGLPVAPAAADTAGDFVIGAADVLAVTVLGEPALSVEVDVSPGGEVNLPLVGAIAVQGLTPVAASQKIADAFVQGQFLVSPQVQVRVLESRNLMISVLGEVRQPGRFAAPTQMSVLDALALAGGIAETGGQRVTVLRYQDGRLQRREVDLTGLAGEGDLRGTPALMLRPGDTVMVPEAARFYIYGEVRSPNAYPLKPGMTVMQALALGGGANERGSRKRIEVQRQNADGVVETRSASLADVVYPNDVIYVRERLF